MAKETGGAAYPSRGGMMFYVPAENKADIEQAVTSLDQEHSGMTIRDACAIAAIPVAMTVVWSDIGYKPENGLDEIQNNARLAYQIADAMLAERSKP